MLLNNGKYQKRQLVHLVSTETYYKAYSMDVQTQAQSAVQTIRIGSILRNQMYMCRPVASTLLV